MTYLHLLSAMSESGLSAEQFAEMIGVSGMSLRRWKDRPGQDEIEKVYQPAIREATYELIARGKLKSDSEWVQAILATPSSAQERAALKNLGISKSFLEGESPSSEKMLSGLCEVGVQEEKQKEVKNNENKIFSFGSHGAEWKKRITLLWDVIQSKEITHLDKMVAFGALFYLITPIDFVPDHIPFFGLLDDMAVLGIAANYYVNRGKKPS